jgi:hypothetical protein
MLLFLKRGCPDAPTITKPVDQIGWLSKTGLETGFFELMP